MSRSLLFHGWPWREGVADRVVDAAKYLEDLKTIRTPTLE